jgi:hypothetical protein
MSDFTAKRQQMQDALDGCGIGRDVEERLNAGHQAIAACAAAFIERAGRQLAYNLLTNIPCGVDIGFDPTEHAIKHGLVTTISARVNFCVSDAERFAADILEDVNDHTLAAFLRKKADQLDAE